VTHSRSLQILSISTAVFASACATDPADSVDTYEASASPGDVATHIMPIRNPDKVDNITPLVAPHLTFFGGPLLRNVDIHPVFWTSNVAFQSNINAFYPAVAGTGSALWAMLAQYGLGFRSAGWPAVVDNRPTGTFTDPQIQTEVLRLINAGSLPGPTSNTYYPVHFPAGVTIKLGTSTSCVQFCAYHSTFQVRNSAGTIINVNYGVVPDIGSPGCNGGCGGNTVVNNTDSVASHELVEAATDPAVGLATVFGPPLGWYDQGNNEEIGDLCNGIQGTSAGFVVQKEWSNAANACVDH
jgi:hypothetical protein